MTFDVVILGDCGSTSMTTQSLSSFAMVADFEIVLPILTVAAGPTCGN